MAPYDASSFDSRTDPRGKTNEEEAVLSLTERLRERESEIRHLRLEKSELENQVRLNGNPIKMDAAYEDLLAHLEQREEDFRSVSKRQEEQHRELEEENRKLKDKVHASRKLLDQQEKNICIIEQETDNDFETMRQRLRIITGESQEKDGQIAMLEDTVESLKEGVAHAKEKEEELEERIVDFKCNQRDLQATIKELQKRVETQRYLFREKEDEILELEKFRHQREDEHSDDIERMRRQYDEIVQAQQDALEEREEEIHLLHQQCDNYDLIIDKAEYVSHEQRAELKAKRKEVEKLSLAIERSQNTGLLGQLDKMCSMGSIESLTTEK